MIIQRRKFITGLAGLIAAPAIVKVSALMPIRGVPLNNISMRLITEYEGVHITSVDILYGYLNIKPDWVLDLPL